MSKIDSWVTKLPRLKNSKVARFSYNAEAYANDDIEGVENFDYSRDMNIPLATHTDFDPDMLSIGARSNFSSVPKNGLNHFFGRVSYNLNKVLDFLVDFLTDFIALNNSFISFTEIVEFSSSATLSNYANGSTKRLLNTAGSNITITLPAGETYLGSNTILLAPSIMLTITKRGTVWINSSGNAITALTADKWKTARNVTISDADGTNTGTAVSVDGSENETLKLPATIKANLTGNAATADKWKTARTIAISDADGTNTGTAVSVDGSENKTLKLPATIKATLSGNAATATKLATARKINGVSFDGSANITIADSTKAPIAHASTATTYGVSNASNYGHAKASGTTPKINGTAAVGTEVSTFARGDHVHPIDTTREPAFTKNTAFNKNFETTASNIKANGTQSVGSSSNVPRADHVHPTDTSRAPTSHASTATTYGVASETNYGHAKASNVAPSANGTASKGSTPTVFAQSNHVHPLQTSVSGNAGTATKLATARKINGVLFDGSADITVTSVASKANVRVSLQHGNTWFAKTWTGLTNFNGSYIWTDGENIYHSEGSSRQYVLNKATSTWTVKTWTGLTNFSGSYIWTDGDNIYYSNGGTNRVLNKTTSTWSSKTWNGLTDFSGYDVWTDGDNIYYSNGGTNRVLNKTTSTWSSKTWNGLTDFSGYDVWTDGDNVYFSNDTTHYVLNKATSTWSSKTWNGLTDFRGDYVWTDGENIYYSYGGTQYVLNKSTSTWSSKTWNGLTDFRGDYVWTAFRGDYVWTDGDNVYFSNDTTHYVLPATRHNYVDDTKYNSLFGTVVKCRCKTLSARFVFSNE